MTCYSPVTAYHSNQKNPTGKRSLVFNSKDAIRPDQPLKISCGYCIGCRARKAAEHGLRIEHEAKSHEHSWFVTLTHDDDHMPMHGSVSKKECQRFFKRLRKKFPDQNIRYDLVSEYGPNGSYRPHYHMALFGLEIPDLSHLTGKGDFAEYESEIIETVWGNGYTHVGTLTPYSAGYIGGYIHNKIVGEQADDHYTRPDPWTGEPVRVQEEFRLASKRPAIGKDWFHQYGLSDIYSAGDFAVSRGEKKPVPVYYDKLLEKHHPEMFEAIKQRRREAAKQAENHPDNTWQRLRDREIAQHEKRKFFQQAKDTKP